jgi:hypothetical protein
MYAVKIYKTPAGRPLGLVLTQHKAQKKPYIKFLPDIAFIEMKIDLTHSFIPCDRLLYFCSTFKRTKIPKEENGLVVNQQIYMNVLLTTKQQLWQYMTYLTVSYSEW